MPSSSRLARVLQTMPVDIRKLLAERDLTAAYRDRPAYQKEDYLAWIEGAKFSMIRNRRISQMLDELERGDRYMSAEYRVQPTEPGES